MASPAGTAPAAAIFEVDLPSGTGKLQLRTQDEVDHWEELAGKYVQEYGLSKANDLALLGAILSQHLVMFRAQQKMNGMVPETDASGVPTGRYTIDPDMKGQDIATAQNQIGNASGEIRDMEKALGVDKKTREAGGAYNTGDYLKNLKRAAHKMGIHIHRRVKMYEKFNMELRWKLRLLRNGDPEDRAEHDLTPEKILAWCESELTTIEAEDKKFAKQQAVFIGKL